MLLGLIAAFLFAIICSAALSVGFRRRGPGPVNGLLYFFLLIFVFAWAGGVWLSPIGPVMWNVPWLNFFITAFFIMMLIALLVPPVRVPGPALGKQDTDVPDAIAITFGFLFWFIIVLVGLAAVFGIYRAY